MKNPLCYLKRRNKKMGFYHKITVNRKIAMGVNYEK